MTFLMRWITAGLLLSASVAPASAWATPVSPVTATAAPTGCRADGQCAGLPLDFHTGGSLRSPGPMWAGRWWFTDAHGMAHQGSCTFNRGVHPAHAVPSHRVR